LPWIASACRLQPMVRRGSTVRVRQRALQKPRIRAFPFGCTCTISSCPRRAAMADGWCGRTGIRGDRGSGGERVRALGRVGGTQLPGARGRRAARRRRQVPLGGGRQGRRRVRTRAQLPRPRRGRPDRARLHLRRRLGGMGTALLGEQDGSVGDDRLDARLRVDASVSPTSCRCPHRTKCGKSPQGKATLPQFDSKQEPGANHARRRSERPRQRSQGGQLRMEPLWSPAEREGVDLRAPQDAKSRRPEGLTGLDATTLTGITSSGK
jgi:hypothetical protein